MIVVLPDAGGADDGDLLARRDAERDVAQHPVLAAVGEPDVLEHDLAARRAARRVRHVRACGSSASTSRSAKMRSAAVIDDCITAYLALKSRIGTKNWLMYWMNAQTVPTCERAATELPAAVPQHHGDRDAC